MCAIKHINFEFVFRKATSHAVRRYCVCVLSVGTLRARVDHAGVVDSQIRTIHTLTHTCTWIVQAFSNSYLFREGEHEQQTSFWQYIKILCISLSLSLPISTSLWQNVTFPWTLCVRVCSDGCGLKCGKMLNMIWVGLGMWMRLAVRPNIAFAYITTFSLHFIHTYQF